jgi:Arc/MetJ-type ribon-helix-helix transcriptional regulator
MAAETSATTIRLTDKDREHIEKLIELGVASNASEAIRVALGLAPKYLQLRNELVHSREILEASMEGLIAGLQETLLERGVTMSPSTAKRRR